ncbi:hypothetical protein QIS74_04818 [Colletotrichum tabaci]|uniref:Ribosomal RNA methyltransferase FtsJ domain-containing protein n=1 Tax=Colletotrichum tabaci TaxID=1209068 RepID=A0AAV9TL55_9PEZI
MATVTSNEMASDQVSKAGEHLSDATTQMAIMSISEHGAKNPDQEHEAKKKVLGWENPAGDKFFMQQRHKADNPDDQLTQAFYDMMKRIGKEMQKCTGALKVKTAGWGKPQILDMGMAPGGFLAVAMELNPGAHAIGFSLPEPAGGHKVMLPDDANIDRRDLDVTMLAEDLGFTEIPSNHPDAGRFVPRQFAANQQQFDLVICGGAVVRKQERASYREAYEAHRLSASQLALGLERLRPGGTMVVLFHKVEAWGTARELYTFDGFSRARLFKPTTGHNKRSSFYMVATDVQSRHPRALRAVARWKGIWEAATFRAEGELLKAMGSGEPGAEELLEEFGEQMVRRGRKVWKIQADALERAPFMRDKRDGSDTVA